MLQTQEMLRSEGLGALTEGLGISARRGSRHPNLVFLKYNQLNSPLGHPVVRECRGLIVDEAEDWRVVSHPFDKFFNAGEPFAAEVDWGAARVYEKLDGSLMTLYWYDGAWQVASNGTPDAGGSVWGHTGTFGDLFWETFKGEGYGVPGEEGRGWSFMFELMTPHNRVVVPHKERRLVLIGARELSTHREAAAEEVGARFGWRPVKSFSLASMEECLASCAGLDPMQSEGFVVCDGAFRRVKIKSPKYVMLAHLKENLSPRRMLEIVRANETSEVLTYFPEMRSQFDRVSAAFAAVVAEIEADYGRLKEISEQKAFAAEAVKTRCAAALFALRGGKVGSVREHFAGAALPAVERVLGAAFFEACGVAGTPDASTEK